MEAITRAKESEIVDLSKEMETIHLDNTRYWRNRDHSREAAAEYYWRQKRLEELRSQLITAK